jgi:CHAT domain-containing protein/Flp pilus assembly protein TadD
VLQQQWKYRWRHRQWRRHKTLAATTLARFLLAWLMVFAAGCGQREKAPPDWQKLYSEARQKKDLRDKTALDMAERGFKETALDPVLNYRFRILVAENEACSEHSQRSQDLLAISPPATPERNELEAERNLARALLEGCFGHLADADARLSAAEELAQTSKPELLPRIQYSKAWIAAKRKDLRQQEEAYKKCVLLAHKYPHPVEASALTGLGKLYFERHSYSDAVEMYDQALKAARQWHDRFIEERVLGDLGYLYLVVGNYFESEDYSKPAVELAAAIGEEDDQRQWLMNLGIAYQADARQLYDETEAAYSQAIVLAKKLGNNDTVISAFENLAQLSLKRGNIAKAKDYVRQAEALHPKNERALYLLLGQSGIALAEPDYPQAQKLLEKAVHISPAPPLPLMWRFQTYLARAYAAQKNDRMADRWFRSAINIPEKFCGAVKEDEHKISCLGLAPYYSAYIAFLIDRNRPLEALAVAELGRSRTLAETAVARTPEKAAANIRKVQSSLREGKQVVLAYFLADDRCYMWAVTHSKVIAYTLPPLKDLYVSIYDYGQQIQAMQKLGDSHTATQLYELLVRPAEKLIPRGAQVTIVPNRNLYALNFETLVVPSPAPHYWIEDVELRVCSSFSILAAPPRPRRATPKQLLLIGAAAQALEGPRPLSNAPEEMRRIAGHFAPRQQHIISGSDATPQAYLTSHPEEFRLVHFAAHGLASLSSPLDSAIILSPQPDGVYKLLARSIIKTRINADVVTISSCESLGKRTFDSEGVIGLGWAFMRAGAHAVVAGLWDMDDASSPQLMDDFYAGITGGKSASQALHEAKLKMLHSGGNRQRPYYWGTLQVHIGP